MNTRTLELVGGGTVALWGMGEGLRNHRDWQARFVPAKSRIPNTELKTHEGRTVRFYDDLVRDKLVVINMMYAGCNNACAPMTQNLVRAQQLLRDRVGKDIHMYSLTLRPEHDEPQDL